MSTKIITDPQKLNDIINKNHRLRYLLRFEYCVNPKNVSSLTILSNLGKIILVADGTTIPFTAGGKDAALIGLPEDSEWLKFVVDHILAREIISIINDN